ncbi:MAG: intradiol ring-cleavage dioxygenase [Pseudomonadota bacterium]
MERRTLIKGLAAGAVVLGGGAAVALSWLNRKFNPRTPLEYAFPPASAATGELTPTPACESPQSPTLRQTEGPFYTPETPERMSLREVGVAGDPLVLEGQVVDTACRPIVGAVVDIWSCDGNGDYDNKGFRLRGHQFTDAQGRFRFETVRPVAYKAGFVMRTPHLHVKVQGRDTPMLTTQIYFPDEALNERDSIYDDALLVAMDESGGHPTAMYRFVLARNG